MTDDSNNRRQRSPCHRKEMAHPTPEPMPELPTKFGSCVGMKSYNSPHTPQYTACLKEKPDQ